jgi:hypothetical protein
VEQVKGLPGFQVALMPQSLSPHEELNKKPNNRSVAFSVGEVALF